jgi:outer membrane receptor protein involved in Fe transport
MKSNFKQPAVRLGGWARPGYTRACFAVVVITSFVYSHTIQAQTDNPPAALPPTTGETNNPPATLVAPVSPTNNPTVTSPPVNAETSTNVTKLPEVTVYGKLDQARSQIMPDLGATAYSMSKVQIDSEAQGDNAPFNQVILRAPGVAQDSAANGDLHVRGEHANLQYRINDVLLPEGITGFGLELDPRFVDSLEFITGSLPAQYGFRTAGIVDIRTKSGAVAPGGEVDMYGGSYDTLRPSFEYGGSQGKLSYFIDGSYDHNGIGIENPTSSATPIHDTTDQGKMFSYVSYILDDTSRLNLMLSASYSNFQVPDSPGLPAGKSPNGNPWLPGTFNSAALNENQNEQNYYGVVTYQKTAGDLNFQTSAFGRNSSVHFTPDPVGDLFFNGVASDVDRTLYSGGVQTDASYKLNDKHTIRGGFMVLDETVAADSTTTVFPVDGSGNPTGTASPIVDNHVLHGLFYGVYLQDEWKLFSKLTLNYGARFDVFSSSFDDENQLSPRVNLIYQPTDKTTLHAGYARYFTPPPVENVPGSSVAKFDGTSNASETNLDSSVKAERIISTRESARNYCPDCKRAWTATTNLPAINSTMDCLGRHSSSRRSIIVKDGLMAWNSRRRTSMTGCRCMPTLRFPRRRAKTGVQHSFCSIRTIWLTSRTIGSISITTRG